LPQETVFQVRKNISVDELKNLREILFREFFVSWRSYTTSLQTAFGKQKTCHFIRKNPGTQ